MSDTPAARLARVKVNHPLWQIERRPELHSIGYQAIGPNGQRVTAASVTELENKLNRKDKTT